jgi:peptidyl-prolyl cis-trans isomerase SurA
LKKLILIAFLLVGINSFAQNTGKVLDEIVAVIGDNIIMRSELEVEYLQAKSEMDFYDGDLKCEILNQLIIQKLYLHKGELDSTYAAADRVNAEVERRIKHYASQIGGEEKLEKYLGKSIAEYKELMKPKIEEQMIVQQVQQNLVADVKVSPTEVRQYFNDIPKDSLPKFEQEVELAQITMAPSPNDYAKQYALEKITKIREEIMQGLFKFDFAAKTQSDDKGSAINGGETGYFSRGQMVSAFERMAFKLKKDSVSGIIETEYGYHILQLIDRKGEKVNVRHILIKPLIVKNDYLRLLNRMNILVDGIKKDSISLCHVASTYSTDPYTKDNCGFYTDPNTGSQQVPVKSLEPLVARKLTSINLGDYSKPEQFTNYDGSIAYRFFYYKKSIPAHTANLKDDYQKIQNFALEKKQDQMVKDWVLSYKAGVYVWVDDKYKNCEELKGWKGLNN